MGTEVHYKSSLSKYYSMGDVNEDSNGSSWPLFYEDKASTNSHFYNGFIPNEHQGYDKDALKQKMLEHESIFRNQVYELHRLYRRQRDMMEEVKRNEFNNSQRIFIDSSSSSSLVPSQKPYGNGQNWHIPNGPLVNSNYARTSIFGADISNSPLSCSKANSSKDCEVVECRPSKVRKKLFDLQLPAHEYIDPEENEEIQENHASEISSYPPRENGLADLNEPVHVEETIASPSADFLGQPRELFEKSRNGSQNGAFDHLPAEGKGNGRDWFSCSHEAGNNRSYMNIRPQCFQSDKLRINDQEHQRPKTYSDFSAKSQNRSHFDQMPSAFATSGVSSSYPFVNSSYTGKPNGSLTQKLTSFLSAPRGQNHEVMNYRPMTVDPPAQNGFHHGSSSGSKEIPARLPSIDGSQKLFKSSNFIDLTDTNKGIDLNTVQTSSDEDINKNDDIKILGIPVYGKSCVSKNDSSSLISTSASLCGAPENGSRTKKTENRGIDINVAWDGEMDTEIKNFKNHFDLNFCANEDEDILAMDSVKSSGDEVKKTRMEIDLEAPAGSEFEEPERSPERQPENRDGVDFVKVAAEAIVTISHAGSTSDEVVIDGDGDGDDRLLRFVEVITNLDEYEMLTLQLEETKEEDYMPKPVGPGEVGPAMLQARPRRGQARRGRPRRDFQRDILPGLVSLSRHEVTEDLQIFGGLMKATGHSWNLGLSKRKGGRGRRKKVATEVVEPPLAATPPPPPPPPPTLAERSLTGWGKTTRRPRRQRCAGGNLVAVPLT